MGSKDQNNTSSIPDILNELVNDTLIKALSHEESSFKVLINELEEQFKSYSSKTSEILKDFNISAYLFISYNTSLEIKKLLDEYSKSEEYKQSFTELNKFHAATLKILNIESGNDSAEDSSSISRSVYIKSILKKWMSSLGLKRPDHEKLVECYRFKHIISDVLHDHLPAISNLEKARADLLLSVWENSKLINNNIILLSDHNYELPADGEGLSANFNLEDISHLMEVFVKENESLAKSIKNRIRESYDSVLKDETEMNAVITEHPSRYTPEKIIRSVKLLENEHSELRSNWNNTLLALTDDWAIELEIYSLKYDILKGYFNFLRFVDTRLKIPLDDGIKAIRDNIEKMEELFVTAENITAEDQIKSLIQGKSDLRRILLLKLLPNVRNLFLNSDLPTSIDEFEKKTIVQFDSLSKSRLLIKNPVYDKPIDDSGLEKISPHSLISFEMQPQFTKVFPKLKNEIIRHLQLLQVRLEEIPEIVEFSVESAIGYYEEKKDLSESLKIGVEGVKRAINKIDDLSDLRNDFYKSEVDNMEEKINQLISDIYEITDSESALQIKIRITKARAIEHSKAFRDNIISKIKNFLPKVLEKFQSLYDYLLATSIKIRKQFDGGEKKGFISSDVSDYLAETEEAINRLPFVYQRLFKIEPITNFDLYIQPEQAMEKIKLAYSKWKEGKFSPTVVFGENGSGKTSFVNRFLALKVIAEKITLFDLYRTNITAEQVYGSIYNEVKIYLEDVQENQLSINKKIVLIDGFEKLFEARINGFEIVRKLLKLISKTNKKVFWIIICPTYPYKYLDKSIQLSDYFGYHIELKDLTKTELITIIEKRHNISGFRLQFLPSEQKKSLIPMKRQADKDDPEALKEEYFERLHWIVKGNITQAFLYWMRSAADVTEDVLFLNMPGESNLDLVKSIPLAKFEILKNILVHNGISAANHAKVYRISLEQSELKLEQLYDDGIIIKREGIYNINPMIYKQLIDRMFYLNLLH